MADDKPDEATQTTPQGHEIPVPEREAVIRDLMKVAPPVRPGAETAATEDDSADEPDPSAPKP
jgi:hypothetical protein